MGIFTKTLGSWNVRKALPCGDVYHLFRHAIKKMAKLKD